MTDNSDNPHRPIDVAPYLPMHEREFVRRVAREEGTAPEAVVAAAVNREFLRQFARRARAARGKLPTVGDPRQRTLPGIPVATVDSGAPTGHRPPAQRGGRDTAARSALPPSGNTGGKSR